jgi:CYTH domain-containing protein
VQIGIDIFLGKLWGLNIALAQFETEVSFSEFTEPDFSIVDVTGNKFFLGNQLVSKTFEDVRAEVNKIIKN